MRDDLARTALLEQAIPGVGDGEVLLRVDRVGVTANKRRLCGAGRSATGISSGPANAEAGRAGPEHANSICSFSGLNDEPEAEFPEGGRVQSYGRLVSQDLKSELPSPGTLCNGHLFSYPEGFPEE